jgi:hypothetical protein
VGKWGKDSDTLRRRPQEGRGGNAMDGSRGAPRAEACVHCVGWMLSRTRGNICVSLNFM